MFPDLLPALSFDGNSPTISWKRHSPRVGATIALDDHAKRWRARRSALRRPSEPVRVTSAQPRRLVLHLHLPTDGSTPTATGSHRMNEILTQSGPQYSNASTRRARPARPRRTRSIRITTPTTTTISIFGIDPELIPNLAVVRHTHSDDRRLAELEPRIAMTSPTTRSWEADQRGNTAVLFAPNAASWTPPSWTDPTTARLHSNYSGIEFTLNNDCRTGDDARRLFVQQLDRVLHRPRRSTESDATEPTTRTWSAPQVDGGQIAPRIGRVGKGDLFYNAKWQLNCHGFYQLGGGSTSAPKPVRPAGYVNPSISRPVPGVTALYRAAWPLSTSPSPISGRPGSEARQDLKIQRVNLILAADVFHVLNTGRSCNATAISIRG